VNAGAALAQTTKSETDNPTVNRSAEVLMGCFLDGWF